MSLRSRSLGHRARRVSVVSGMVGVAMAMVMSSSAWAAVPIVTLSADPYTNQTSYHQTEVEPDTYSFGSTIVAAFQVGRFSDGGSSNLGFATTTNNGTSWTNGFMPGTTVYANPPGTWARISDPSVTYDVKHNVWMIVGLVLDANVSAHGLVVNRSTDGGLTWQNPVNANLNQGSYDKQWMTCDNWPNSPFYGNCYIEWAGNTGISMTRSTDGGLTWNQSQTPFAGGNGGQPLVQPSGKVVVPYTGNGMQDIVSTNGGQTFGGPFTIATATSHFVAGSLRTELLPSAEMDAAGEIYLTWQDCRYRSGCSANDIVMSSTTDGTTWSPVVRIPIDPVTSTADHFIPGIAADPATSGATAHLGLAYYFYPQASCNTGTCKLQIGYVSSTDGGTTWTAPTVIGQPMRVTWLPFTTLGYMVGDYISTSFGSNGKAYPALAQAKVTSNCTTNQVGSCHEFMITARAGLSVGPGTVPVNPHDRVVFQPTSGAIRIPTLW
jgi:hypothetical protein